MASIEGTIEYIVYPATFTKPVEFAVLQLKTKNGRVKAVGEIVPCKKGESFVFDGNFNSHPKHGKSFVFQMWKRNQEGESGAKSFLAFLFGPKTSERLIAVHGEPEDVLEMFKNDADKLIIKGIGNKTIQKAKKRYQEHQVSEVLFTNLKPFGMTMHLALKIFKKYGTNALEHLEENPYRLIDDFDLSFARCDQLADYFKVSHTDARRLQAGILFGMKKAMSKGHVFVYVNDLLRFAARIINEGKIATSHMYITQAFSDVVKTGRLTIEKGDKVYFPSYLRYERDSANFAKRLRGKSKTQPTSSLVKAFETKHQITFATQQKNAILKAISNRFSIITGPPGSGKTTVNRAIIEIFRSIFFDTYKRYPKIGLAAPTGKAAKRMGEATGEPAFTLHKLLDYRPVEGRWEFAHSEVTPLPYDLLIFDEYSMTDLYLHYHVFRAIQPGTIVVLVGDKKQLPSVGAGNVFEDLLESGIFPVTTLDAVYRQKNTGNKGKNEPLSGYERAVLLREGIVPDLTNGADFTFFDHIDELTLKEEMVNRYYQAVLDYGKDEVVILTPMNKTMFGTDELNKVIQAELNPPKAGKREAKFGHTIFREGDRVIQRTPNEEFGLVNGQMGYIKSYIPPDPQTGDDELLVIDYEGELKEYTRDRFDEILLGYALTIHKSQGSEWKCVIMPAISEHAFMLDLPLLYTGWTRYKEALAIFGERQAIEKVIKHNKPKVRNSQMKERLRGWVA